MTALSSDNLQQICAEALRAFALTPVTGDPQLIDSSFLALKNDDSSLVVRVSCNEKDSFNAHSGEQKFFVLKSVREDLYFGSEATASIEQVLSARFIMDSDNTASLIACRRKTAEGNYLFRQLANDKPSVIWTVSEYVANSSSFDWLDSPADWTADHAKSAGELLARAHRLAYESRKEFVDESFGDLPTIVHSVPEWLASAFALVLPDSDAQTILTPEVKRSLLEQIEEVTYELTAGGYSADLSSEMTAIHGDFQPGNVLYEGGKAVSIIDWDYAHFDHPLLDVAYGLVMFGGKLACGQMAVIDTTIANAFLDGYKRICPTEGLLPEGPLAAALCSESQDVSIRRENVFGMVCASPLLASYIKLASALILLWALSEQGKNHKQRHTVLRKAIQLMLS